MRKGSNILTYTRLLLKQWANLNQSELPNLSHPAHYDSPGRGTRGSSIHIPKEIDAVERAVNGSDPRDRRILQIHYLHAGSIRDKTQQLNCSNRCYYGWLEQAEWAIHRAIE